jgi:glycosyltransferase involved in cell wall biosynthesis
MTELPKIGLVAPLPPQVGGIASFAQWALEHETEIGCRYHTFDLRRPPEEETGGRLRADAIPRQVVLLLSFLRWMRTAPGVVHYNVALTATGLPRDLLYVALLRGTRRQTVVHIHGPAFEPSRAPAVKLLLLRALSRLSTARLAAFPLAGWHFVPNPLRLQPEERSNHRATADLRLLAVGRVGEQKGSDVLIDAVAALREAGVSATVRFAGRELRRTEERALRQRVRARGLDESVEFAGVLSPDRLRDEYRHADVFCLPSLQEGLPMALLEAMAFDLPVVVTPVGAIPMLVEDGRTGLLVEPGNAERLARAIELLATDASLRARLGEAGGARVRSMCAPDVIAEQWRLLYAKLLH